jgi:hypothetical protein
VDENWLHESGEAFSGFCDELLSASSWQLSTSSESLSASDEHSFTSIFPCSIIHTFFFNPYLPYTPTPRLPHSPTSLLPAASLANRSAKNGDNLFAAESRVADGYADKFIALRSGFAQLFLHGAGLFRCQQFVFPGINFGFRVAL